MQPDNDRRAEKEKERSPLDGILEDPKPNDRGLGQLDKAPWDPSNKHHVPGADVEPLKKPKEPN